MPTQSYSIEPNAPKRLTVSWNGMWKNFTVTFDGQPLMTMANKAELDAGKDATLSDGSTLRVQFKKSFGGGGLEITRDGQPLPGTATDPSSVVKTASYILYFIAGLNVVLGGLTLALKIQILESLGFGVLSIGIGFVIGILGYFSMQGSRIALGVAIVLYLADTAGGLFALAQSGGTGGIGGLFMRFYFLSALFKGFVAAGQLKKADAPAQSPR